jgi:hypothetical protein
MSDILIGAMVVAAGFAAGWYFRDQLSRARHRRASELRRRLRDDGRPAMTEAPPAPELRAPAEEKFTGRLRHRD